jgi:hypothetical protein
MLKKQDLNHETSLGKRSVFEQGTYSCSNPLSSYKNTIEEIIREEKKK